ncbi:RND family efflux transporter MFP subunit [Bosea sp. OAE752]|jgi:RND family efflux transporter MFP subunit|uniref:Efflux RND transporter periplasmic adaptor subunit n=1 Tax=Bosea spartocytisi TaxID=2773451 RepID=A0A927HX19_9HYPH|nr:MULTISPECIES: efflux RND transporter periplasmic adaptor subunit [Bosea]MBD3844930.1 efflux RND transporter periplasmic adaptor subunit [Bosea spartocytisi]MCT4471131.1 efflux RND transporter periplasmic adaptor subunit [Bosea spartocytisi]
MSRSRFIGLVLAAAASTILVQQDASAQGAPPAPPVQIANPLAKRVTNWDEYTGRFEASEQVEVRARVSGFIDRVHFRDGALVQKGDLLFTIDQRPYKLAVDVAQADIARAKAQVDLARNEVERAEGLTQNRTITARDVDQRRANLDSAVGTLQGAEANLKTAQLNLEWTEVRAPLAGRISNRRVDPGNLISGGQSGATLLTTIVAVDPIYFTFDVSEADYLRYARMANPRDGASRDSGTVVEVRLSDEAKWDRRGKVNFLDNALNARSATIRGRAVFDNKDQFLTPGVFGRLRFFAGEADALLVPDAVIASDQSHKVVLTVGPENKVVPKIVELGPLSEGLRVIRAGLTSQDKVIVGGNANPMVRPGVAVTPQPGEIKVATTN